MFSKRGEISTLVVLGVLSIIGVATLISSTSPNRRNILNTRAASGSFSQCNASGSNQPCGSCNITDISVDSAGKATMTYGCQLLCDQIDIASCPVGTYEVKDSSWFWCSGADGSSCTEHDSDLKKNVHSTDSTAIFTVSSTNTNETKSGLKQSATFEGWKGCGRVQADIQINAPGISVAGFTKSFGSSCGDTGTTENTPVPNNPNPTNTPNSQNSPTRTPTPGSCRPGEFKCPDTGKCVADQGECQTATKAPTPTITITCVGNLKKCLGVNVCRLSAAECPNADTPTPTKTPTKTRTPTPKNSTQPSPTITCVSPMKMCSGYSGCYRSFENCPSVPARTINTPTPTPRQQVTSNAPTPTPVPVPKSKIITLQEQKVIESCSLVDGVYPRTFECYWEGGKLGLEAFLDNFR